MALTSYGLMLHILMYALEYWDFKLTEKTLFDELKRRRDVTTVSVDLSFVHFLLVAWAGSTEPGSGWVEFLGQLALMLQLLITPAYWVELYDWDRAFVADPTGMMIDFFWHG